MDKLEDEAIVISGVSTLLPGCDNIVEFSKKLYDKVNLVSESFSRWSYNHPELPSHQGFVTGLDRCDVSFFNIHQLLSNNMDCSTRKLLEHSFQTIFDAGLSPSELDGKRVGVYIAAGGNEAEDMMTATDVFHSVVGCYKTMMANRISYYLNLKGPSVIVEVGAAGSITALEKAYNAILTDQCEAALVGASRTLLHPQTPIHYSRLVSACADGKTKCYDENADGQAMSEAINMIFLQKYKNAKRVYAQLCHVKTGCSAPTEERGYQTFGPYREVEVTKDFLCKFYNEANVSPSSVEYVEGFGAALQAADKAELSAFDEVFCHNRKEPLLVGSVMSNVGYTDNASALTAIIKILLANQRGELAGNINCKNPRRDIQALKDGNMRILNDHAPFKRSYAAVNNYSLSGVNGHALLKGFHKYKNLIQYSSSIPHLVLVSGRMEGSVQRILDDITGRTIDPEELVLLNNVHKKSITNHLARGFGIYSKKAEGTAECVYQEVEHHDSPRKPLWFVFTGMGSQWPAMGAKLMSIPIFAGAIQRCHKALEPFGVDLVTVITSPEKQTFDNILNCFIGIAAVQIGLMDVLRAIGLKPDNYIGHSAGEMGCAYADGCCTLEETILMSYYRGLVSLETPFIKGCMAAVGLGYKELCGLVPPEIQIACHNGPTSCTISGPVDNVASFVTKLKARQIFAKEVPSSNIAYHSRYIAQAGPTFLKYLTQVYKTPKLRSERWISTSIPKEKWDEPIAKYSSPEYHTNNLLNPVLFEEVLEMVPRNAVVVEVAPHGLLQAVLKRSLPSDCHNIALTSRTHDDGALFLLQAIGKLYMEGYDIDISALYPKIEYPVSSETRSLSHLVEWNHSQKLKLSCFIDVDRKRESIYKPIITIYDDEYQYLTGHVVDGIRTLPFAGLLVLVWEAMAMFRDKEIKNQSVEFNDVTLHHQPVLADDETLYLTVMVHRGSGKFEVTHQENIILEGQIKELDSNPEEASNDLKDNFRLDLSQTDIYKLLFERGYQYQGEFKSLQAANLALNTAKLTNNRNWVTIIDGALQLLSLHQKSSGVSQVQYVKQICIDVNKHEALINKDIKYSNELDLKYIEDINVVRCGGLQMKEVLFKNLPAAINKSVAYEELSVKVQNSKNVLPDLGKKTMVLHNGHRGDINSLSWTEKPVEHDSGIPVTVHYAGLSVYDAKKALDEVKSDCSAGFGMDFSGVTDRGERVMGLSPTGSTRGVLVSEPHLLWPVPQHWTLEDAATVPLPYTLAFYCLTVKCELTPGMSILVQGGAGALGQAVISIALAQHCKVYTTVSSIAKRQFLRNLFPKLPAEHIFYSRDDSFCDAVKLATKGRGCDLVISCVRGDLKKYTVKCAGQCGITMDVVQVHLQDRYDFEMENLTKERSYMTVDFSLIFRNKQELKELQLLLSEGITKGFVRPLSRVTYSPDQTSRAFGLLAGSRHRGRVLLKLSDTGGTLVKPSLMCSSNGSHLIVFDDEIYAVQFANRLIINGARKIHLHCPRQSGYLLRKLNDWKQLGIKVQITQQNNEDSKTIPTLLKEANLLAPVEGIYLLNVRKGTNLTSIVQSLDLSSRNMCSKLRYFAVVSSECLIDNDVCLARSKTGFQATFVQLQHAEMFEEDTNDSLNNISRKHLKMNSALNAIEKIMCSNKTCVVVSPNVEDENNASNKKVTNRVRHQICVEENKVRTYFDKHINNINHDELEANLEVVIMPSLVHNSELRSDEVNIEEPILCVVPGVEGNHTRFRVLSERLKIPTVVLQPGFDHENESIKDTAQRFVETITKFGVKRYFYLLGYEFGSLVITEMAALLESRGIQGTVMHLSGSPENILSRFKASFDNASTETIQNNLIVHLFELLTDLDIDMDSQLVSKTWEEKIEILIRELRSYVKCSTQYLEAVAKTLYSRILSVKNYTLNKTELKSTNVVVLGDMDPNNLKCSSVVNQNLCSDVLEKYSRLNHCQTSFTETNVTQIRYPEW